MKRDMDFVREILLGIEELDTDGNGCDSTHLRSYLKEKGYDDSDDKMYGHCKMMNQAGLIEFSTRRVAGGRWILERPIKLLWEGRDLLDNIRDQGVWEKIKEKVNSKMDSISFGVLKAIAVETSKELFRGFFG